MDDENQDDSQDNSGEQSGRSYGGQRDMHTAVCSDCGQECEVPFAPTPGRPVYCRNCFQKHKKPSGGGGGRGGRDGGRGRY